MNRLTQKFIATAAFFIGIGVFLVPTSVLAQNQSDQLHLGVEGGLAQSQFTGDGTDASSYQGFSGGINFMYNLNEALSVEVKALYTESGADEVTASADPGTSSPAFNLDGDKFALDYYQFPILAKLTAPIEVVKIRALAGPAISFLDGATKNGEDTRRNVQSEPPVNRRFKFYDLSGVVGGEIAVPLSGLLNAEVAVEGRYQFGLPNIDNQQGFEIKNQSFNGALTFRIPL
ncbi:porin family protein [Salinibacter sp.]|jgi:hypothetical protein|uniref:porin family protein n=1 Tax=Salinibacter sp. TaxID=2065818 RepID=UPI0021E89E5C|nr:porin family protein [Salinibacter sp.]